MSVPIGARVFRRDDSKVRQVRRVLFRAGAHPCGRSCTVLNSYLGRLAQENKDASDVEILDVVVGCSFADPGDHVDYGMPGRVAHAACGAAACIAVAGG